MKRFLILSILLLAPLPTFAQYDSITPAKQAEYQKRFQEALAKYTSGRFAEARTQCEGILKEVPNARGSLLIAGRASLDLWEPEKAAPYLESFHKLEPKDFQGIIFGIQANQALKRTVKVEALRQELFALRKSATSPIKGLTDAEEYTRERIRGAKNTIITVREYFDPKAAPYRAWEVRQIEGESKTVRSFDFSYSADASTRAQQAGNPKAEYYMFSEIIIKDEKPVQIALYREEKSKPDYSVFRKWFMEAIETPPKPLYVSPL